MLLYSSSSYVKVTWSWVMQTHAGVAYLRLQSAACECWTWSQIVVHKSVSWKEQVSLILGKQENREWLEGVRLNLLLCV